MAKKFVRGITDIKNIEHQDFDTNNVNDLLSDGQHNYIHRKKGNSEEYHNLTNNLKTLQSDNTDLLTVTNYNNTTNSATIRPKHDVQKEQVLESTDETILISHGENGTDETTTVDVNPEIVLEHDNLISNSEYVTIEHEDESATTEIKTDVLDSKIIEIEEKIPTEIGGRNYLLGTSDQYQTYTSDNYILGYPSTDHNWPALLNRLRDKTVTIKAYIKNDTDFPVRIQIWLSASSIYGNTVAPHSEGWSIGTGKLPNTSDWGSANIALVQEPTTATGGTIQVKEAKLEIRNVKTDWSPAPEDFDTKLAQKQNTLTSNTSIGVGGTGLQQLYTQSETYTHANGIFKTHVKSVANSSSVSTLEEEFNFLAKMNKSQTNAEFTLNEHDTAVFQYLIDTYGVDNKINVCGSLFTLNGSQLTFGSNGAQYNPHIINFCDIIPTSAINVTQ